MKLLHTEQTGLTLERMSNHWRHVDNNQPPITSAPRAVGPIYPTKGEALADTVRYARESWDFKG